MSGEKYTTSSVINPVLNNLLESLDFVVEDYEDYDPQRERETINSKIFEFKDSELDVNELEVQSLQQQINQFIGLNLKNRYKNPKTMNFFQKVQFLDPRFKSTAVITFDDLEEEFNSVEIQNSNVLEQNKPDIGLSSLLKRKRPNLAENVCKAEFDKFFQVPDIELSEDPLQWWRDNKVRFPRMACLARKYLCVPATSVPSERIFSCGGNVISDKRCSLSGEHAEQLIMLHMNAEHIQI